MTQPTASEAPAEDLQLTDNDISFITTFTDEDDEEELAELIEDGVAAILERTNALLRDAMVFDPVSRTLLPASDLLIVHPDDLLDEDGQELATFSSLADGEPSAIEHVTALSETGSLFTIAQLVTSTSFMDASAAVQAVEADYDEDYDESLGDETYENPQGASRA